MFRRLALWAYHRRLWTPRWFQRLAGVSYSFGQTPVTMINGDGTYTIIQCKSGWIVSTNGKGMPSFEGKP